MTRSCIVSGKRSSTSSVSAKESRDRYVARTRGEIPGVPLVTVDEAVKVLRGKKECAEDAIVSQKPRKNADLDRMV